ncbi:ABC transporter permease [Streptomyces formicae]|uniref:ABC transporter permease n=1 Tax=Streptomyces formicae TaxID=1616117 RepID=A0ABY3WR31_9ACTN|nr:ABC transporter permease [Streptomyces formicae]UNM12263.1 ABC transporter permease [Streptomyces formicae]
MNDFLSYIELHAERLAWQASEHAVVVAVAVLLATVVGLATGMATWRSRFFSSAAVGISGVFLTVPSFALLGLLIPLLGLGWKPVLTALTGYALLPVVRNTVVGLQGVRPEVVEAARGSGMRTWKIMLAVRLPLAWPVILSGIRLSTQLTIGIAAIAAYVAGPGLGNEIFGGLSRLGSVNALDQALAGTLGVVLLALCFDAFFAMVRHLTTPRGLRG